MEGNNKAQEIIDLVKTLHEKIGSFEQRIYKNEQLLLHAFSYLYTRQDIVNNFDSNFQIIDKNIKLLNDQVLHINNQLLDITKTELPKEKEKIVRKRPWHYFISKHFRYLKICKERKTIQKQNQIKLEEKLRKQEEERIRAEEERKRKEEQERLNRIKREEQAKLEKEMRKKLARNKMNEILQTINKGEN